MRLHLAIARAHNGSESGWRLLAMQWKFFLGACLLTAAVLQPHAPTRSIIGGIGLAALAQWAWVEAGRQHERRRKLRCNTVRQRKQYNARAIADDLVHRRTDKMQRSETRPNETLKYVL